MGILSRVEQSAMRASVTWSPLDDRWYGSLDGGAVTEAAIRVGPDAAMKYSAVFACINLIARTIASLPLLVYRRLPGEDRERATDHSAYALLRRRPNRWQTAFDWLYLRTAYLLSRGNDVDRLYFNPRTGAVTDLWPLHPDLVRAERVPSGLLRYQVRREDGQTYPLLQDEVVHARDYAPDGIWGLSRIQLGARGIGLAIATEAFRARFFGNNAQPGLALEHPSRLSDVALGHLKTSIAERKGAGQFTPWIAEEGMKIVQLPINAKDSQLIESSAFNVADVARWFGVPLFMIGLEEKSTSWGTGIEEQKQGFVTFTIGSFLELFTQGLNAALFGDDDAYFAEFELKALLRGNTLARFQAYAIAARPGTGWMTRNEIRKSENLNAGPAELDRFLDPLNSGPAGGAGAPAANGAGTANAEAFAILVGDVAQRIAGAEARELERRAGKAGAEPERFRTWADGFFRDHHEYVDRTLDPLAAAWLRLTEQPMAVHLLASEIVARGRQAVDPCPAGQEVDQWKAQRAHQITELVEAALGPREERRAA